jgi:hypothetical protein
MMAEFGVQRTVGRLHRGHEDQHVPVGRRDDIAERLQRPHIVLDVLQDVDADDRVEALLCQLRLIAFLEMTFAQPEPRMIADRFPDAVGRRAIGLDPEHDVGDFEETRGGRADSAPDFQHPRADVATEEPQDVRLVPPRLAHRFEVVRGVGDLGLNVAPVGMHVRMCARNRSHTVP